MEAPTGIKKEAAEQEKAVEGSGNTAAATEGTERAGPGGGAGNRLPSSEQNDQRGSGAGGRPPHSSGGARARPQQHNSAQLNTGPLPADSRLAGVQLEHLAAGCPQPSPQMPRRLGFLLSVAIFSPLTINQFMFICI